MKISKLKTPSINQNGYHKNVLTRERIGTLFTYPIDFTPDDCLSCDGYSLLIVDYEDLYKVIGSKFNQTDDPEGTFRIPDYNITKRFLQPGNDAGSQIDAGLPNITGGYDRNPFEAEKWYAATGAFYNSGTAYEIPNIGTLAANRGLAFDASRSNSIYGNSSTVQPPSQLVHICIKYK